jgi:hypothetical protein
VSFEETVTASYDLLSATFDDPDHSLGEYGTITTGLSSRDRLLVVAHAREEKVCESSTRRLQPRMRRKSMKDKQNINQDELHSEYNFYHSKAVRGKYLALATRQSSHCE